MKTIAAIITLAVAGNAWAGGGHRTYSDETIAFELGRRMGLLETDLIMKDPNDAAKMLKEADVLADGLGVAAPAMPEVGHVDATNHVIVEALLDHKPPRIAADFALGFELQHAWFGAALARRDPSLDISGDLKEIAGLLGDAGVPESVWRRALAKAAAAPTTDNVDALRAKVEAFVTR